MTSQAFHPPDPNAMAWANMRYEAESKSIAVAYILWICFSILGVHRFYLGSPLISLAQLFTLGGLGVWTLIDGFLIPGRIRAVNEEIRIEVYRRHGLPAHYPGATGR
ncbi:TM2 domain-containing protein [Nesterenkonia sp. CF4.4]|uniref:TM2 domain-containing protein n=1 Tax=Nesterenkonia sp. CF4.4 TaxID=3373079 RepID=UPI003EE61A3A